MKGPMHKPIRSSLVRVQLLVAGVVLVVGTAAFIAQDFVVLKRQLRSSLDSTARVLGLNLIPTLSFQDRAEAEKILRSLKAEPSIVGARLFDREGALFAQYGESRADLLVVNDLTFEGEAMGQLVVGARTDVLWSQARKFLLIALGVLAGTFALAFLLSQYASRSLAGPISSLAAVTKRISDSGD